MSERIHPADRGSPAQEPSGAPGAPPGMFAEAPSPWARPAMPYLGTYPPPPEYYAPLRSPDGVPPAPPEHAYGGPYPAFAPDGRVDQARLHAAPQPGQPGDAVNGERGPMVAASGAGVPVGGGTTLGLLWRVLMPIGSALLSFALYTWYGGWQFGLGLVLLLLVHEMGHFVVIRAKGLPAALPVFIPFLGAYVAMRKMPRSVRDEAEIALAGPLAGALGGAVCFALYQAVGEPEGHTLLFLAYFSFVINLLNLLPVAPLDGGHIVAAISRWLWPIGLVLLAAAFLYTFNLLLLVLGWFWFTQTVARFRVSGRQPYYQIGLWARLYVAALYFGLAGALGLALYLTQTLLPAWNFLAP